MADDPLKPPGSGDFSGEFEASEVPAWFIKFLFAALKSPLFAVPKPFETWMIDKVASSGFDLPISQIIGFSGFVFQPASTIDTAETTSSGVFGDLATVGPELTGLADGLYAILFGAYMHNETADRSAIMSVKINATEALTTDCAEHTAAVSAIFPQGGSAPTRIIFKTLSNNGNNTILARYRTGNGASTASFSRRWLAAIKYDNL